MNAFNIEFPSICLRALLEGYSTCGMVGIVLSLSLSLSLSFLSLSLSLSLICCPFQWFQVYRDIIAEYQQAKGLHYPYISILTADWHSVYISLILSWDANLLLDAIELDLNASLHPQN